MRQLEKLRHRWEGNIKTDLKKCMDWNHLALHSGSVYYALCITHAQQDCALSIIHTHSRTERNMQPQYWTLQQRLVYWNQYCDFDKARAV